MLEIKDLIKAHKRQIKCLECIETLQDWITNIEGQRVFELTEYEKSQIKRYKAALLRCYQNYMKLVDETSN